MTASCWKSLATGALLLHPSFAAGESIGESRKLQNRCFANSAQLRQAVRDYVKNPTSTSEVATTYGFPIGSWCVNEIEDFSSMFYGLTTFNEDISGWDVSR